MVAAGSGLAVIFGATLPPMKTIPLLRTVERMPGGLMVVPLLVGAGVVTFAPGTASFFGSFTAALFNGALTILAVFYVCVGTSIELTATPRLLKKGGALLIAKILCGVVAGVVLGRLLGEAPVKAGPFLGLSGPSRKESGRVFVGSVVMCSRAA